MVALDDQPGTREGQTGSPRQSERFIVPRKPGNSGGGKGSHFQRGVRQVDNSEIGMFLQPPLTVGKLQATHHTKAKESPTYRFYALYDKMYRCEGREARGEG